MVAVVGETALLLSVWSCVVVSDVAFKMDVGAAAGELLTGEAGCCWRSDVVNSSSGMDEMDGWGEQETGVEGEGMV